MKTLFLTRHAKSSWDHTYLSDEDRPLKRSGIDDAHIIAGVFSGLKGIPERIVSSPAARARTTAQLFAEDFEMDPAAIMIFDELYHSAPGTMLRVLQTMNDKWNKVMLVAHNPGITDFLNLIKGVQIDNVPTTGVGIVVFEANFWKDIDIGLATLTKFEFPSKYRN